MIFGFDNLLKPILINFIFFGFVGLLVEVIKRIQYIV